MGLFFGSLSGNFYFFRCREVFVCECDQCQFGGCSLRAESALEKILVSLTGSEWEGSTT